MRVRDLIELLVNYNMELLHLLSRGGFLMSYNNLKDKRKRVKNSSYLDFDAMNLTLQEGVSFRAILDLIDLFKYGNKEVKTKSSGEYNIVELIEYFSQTSRLVDIYHKTERLCRAEYGDEKVDIVLHGERNVYLNEPEDPFT